MGSCELVSTGRRQIDKDLCADPFGVAARAVSNTDTSELPEATIELPIDGTLDLHAFAPGDAAALVGDYLDECRSRRILEVRIIHGKGIGTLRRIVHAALERRDDVAAYRLAGDASSWGATLVSLVEPDPDISDQSDTPDQPDQPDQTARPDPLSTIGRGGPT